MSLFNIVFFVASIAILGAVYVLSDPNKPPENKENILLSVHVQEPQPDSLENIILNLEKD